MYALVLDADIRKALMRAQWTRGVRVTRITLGILGTILAADWWLFHQPLAFLFCMMIVARLTGVDKLLDEDDEHRREREV